ncbi:dual specificity protein phosphatase family protein [Gemmata sp.]|uniref:dual specificity protein phosphatase family protein n=1 Tax=Gemmata sp. TaxID=1914242 RepID=UPI003F6EA7D2
MASRWQVVLGLTAVGIAAAPPIVYTSQHAVQFRNLRVVTEGVLYRSGQLTPDGLKRVIHEKGIKTVVTLRTSRVAGRASPDAWEEEMCAARGVRHVRIVPRLWSPDEAGEVPADDAVREFLAVMDDRANYPVLVHCFAGVHRTGTMCSVYRMEYDRWPCDRAIEEMRTCGFDPIDMRDNIAEYLRNYQPRWKRPGSEGAAGRIE